MPKNVKTAPNGVLYSSLCRELLYTIACRHRQNQNVVILPAFTCKVVVDAFEQADYIIGYYGIKKNLRIDLDSYSQIVALLKPTIVLVHPYFGMELNEEEERLLGFTKMQYSSTIIIDNTQCALSKKHYSFVDYYVASVRKWLPIPDGASLICDSVLEQPDSTNDKFVQIKREAMFLRGQYFISGDETIKSESRRLDSLSAHLLEDSPICIHRMDNYSASVLFSADLKTISSIRMENTTYLYDGLKNIEEIKLPIPISQITTAPILFPFLVDDRCYWQKCLAEKHIYAQYLWPTPNNECLVSEDVRYLYNHHLVFCIDQRYDKNDMNRIINTVRDNEY